MSGTGEPGGTTRGTYQAYSSMSPIETFKGNLAEVDRLINFDRELFQLVTYTLESLHAQLRTHHADDRLNGARALAVIRGIRDNETVKAKYKTIYNQAVVLLVSHFASALGDLFRTAVSKRLLSADPGKLLEEEFKLTVADLKERDWNLGGAVPDLLIAKHDFTFQDMGATVRAFGAYTNLDPPRGELMNNIITAQACRHVIVHAGGRVSEKSVKQVSKAHSRTFRPLLATGEQLSITLQEVEAIKVDMLRFVETLAGM